MPDQDLSIVWEARKSKLQQIHNWSLSGRIAVQAGKESASASLQWQQRQENYIIRLIGPLGKGTLELEGTSLGVTMRDSNQQLITAGNAETLLQTRFGWQVPVSGLQHWILGLPDPVEKIQTLVLDEQARISELSQSGWQVRFRRYQKTGNLNLPTKLELRHQQLKIKLVIKKWDISP